MNKKTISSTLLSIVIFASFLFTNSLSAEGISRVNMGYLYFGSPKDYTTIVNNTNNSLTTISPSYFDLDSNGDLVITPKLETSFINEMHKKGKKIVPFLSNHWDRAIGQKALKNKDKLVKDIVKAIDQYNLDGVNIDIENLSHTDKDNQTAFIKLLREKLPKEKQLSIAVAANSKDLKVGWHGSYDYKEIAKYADYLMLMAYDESWEGSKAGPIASINFVEKSIEHLLSKGISSNKIVLGIPFYGRIWKSDGMFQGRGVSNNQIDILIDKYKGKVVYNSNSQSPMVTISIPKNDKIKVGYDTILNEGTYTIWFENEQSIKEKLKLIPKYDLRGAGSWSIGQESKNTWDYFDLWLNSKYFSDIKDHWAEESIRSMIQKSWMVGTSSNKFSPDRSLTRAEAATILVRFLELNMETQQSDTRISYNDVPESHWAKDYIRTISHHGIMTGLEDNRFSPDKPLSREEMATILYRIVKDKGIDKKVGSTSKFNDIQPELWSYEYINFISNLGIFGGYEDGTFRPSKQNTRAEMATLMERISHQLKTR